MHHYRLPSMSPYLLCDPWYVPMHCYGFPINPLWIAQCPPYLIMDCPVWPCTPLWMAQFIPISCYGLPSMSSYPLWTAQYVLIPHYGLLIYSHIYYRLLTVSHTSFSTVYSRIISSPDRYQFDFKKLSGWVNFSRSNLEEKRNLFWD